MTAAAPRRTRRSPQDQLDLRALELAAETKARQQAFEEIVALKIGAVSGQLDAQGKTNASNHIENRTWMTSIEDKIDALRIAESRVAAARVLGITVRDWIIALATAGGVIWTMTHGK